MEPAALAASFNLASLDRAFLDDPYPTYRALREHDPVHRIADGSCFLTRYDDLVEVYRDTKTWSSDKKLQFRPNFGDSLLYEHHTTSLVFNDPPSHTRVRRLLAPSFTPRILRAMQPRIEALVDRLLDAAQEHGTVDLIEDFAAAIPVQLIGDLLGIPRNERGPLRNWSLKILGALEPVLSKEQFDALKKELADTKKIAPTGVGEAICHCRGCDPSNIIQPGAEGYKEVKDPETGELLPYMAEGQHAA